MTGEQDTGNPERLPLAERARRGLLAGESELYIHEIAELEYPNLTDKTERDSFERLLHGLVIHGLFPGCSMRILERSEYRLCPVKNRVTIVAWSVPREPYRTWRATQPNPPASSIIHLWLGTIPTPANLPQSKPASPPQSEPDKPESGAAAKRETELQTHRRECQEIGKRLWAENPNSTKADIMKHRDMLFYVQAYTGKNTVPGWLAEIDPRPKDKRRGRPKKIPV